MAAALVVAAQQTVTDERLVSAAVAAGKELDAQKKRIKLADALHEAGNAENQLRSALIYLWSQSQDKNLSDPRASPRRARSTLPN